MNAHSSRAADLRAFRELRRMRLRSAARLAAHDRASLRLYVLGEIEHPLAGHLLGRALEERKAQR